MLLLFYGLIRHVWFYLLLSPLPHPFKQCVSRGVCVFHQLFFFFFICTGTSMPKRKKTSLFFLCAFWLAICTSVSISDRSTLFYSPGFYRTLIYIYIYNSKKKKRTIVFFFFCQALLDYSARKQSPRRKETGWRDSSYQRTTTKEQAFFFLALLLLT